MIQALSAISTPCQNCDKCKTNFAKRPQAADTQTKRRMVSTLTFMRTRLESRPFYTTKRRFNLCRIRIQPNVGCAAANASICTIALSKRACTAWKKIIAHFLPPARKRKQRNFCLASTPLSTRLLNPVCCPAPQGIARNPALPTRSTA